MAKFPSISITFNKLATTAITRGDKGTVAICIKDEELKGQSFKLNTKLDIPKTLSEKNNKYIERAFIGNITTPKRVLLFIYDGEEVTLNDALDYFETMDIDYICGGHDVVESDLSLFETWIKKMRNEVNKKVVAILPNKESDDEGIINFATDGIVIGKDTLSAKEYCSRIAGLIAGTPLNMSITFAELKEVDYVPSMTKDERDSATEAGKLIIVDDGRKRKLGRGVNSLVKVDSKGSEWQKIKVLAIMDLIYRDIKNTIEDNFIGKYPNNSDSQALLIAAISNYFKILEKDNLLKLNASKIEVDIESKKKWITENTSIDVSEISDIEIKEYPTGAEVFLSASVKPLDSIEDITIKINI